VDIVKIAELMGHQSILTTRRYTHATDGGKRAAIALLASYRKDNCHKFATNGKAAGIIANRKSLITIAN
jgi:hypothetical protein